MADPVAHAVFDDNGKMVNVILWDGEANLGLPDGHRVELYAPEKHAAAWAAANSPDGEAPPADAPKPLRKRLLGK